MLAGPALKNEPVTLGWIWTKLAASESHTLSKDTSLLLFQSQRAPLEYREQDFILSFSPSHVLSFAPALHSPTPSLNLPLSSLSSRPSLLALFSLKPLHLFVYPAVSFSFLPPQHIICETGFAGLDATAADTGIWFLSSGLFNLSHSIWVFFWAPSTICFKERKKKILSFCRLERDVWSSSTFSLLTYISIIVSLALCLLHLPSILFPSNTWLFSLYLWVHLFNSIISWLFSSPPPQ